MNFPLLTRERCELEFTVEISLETVARFVWYFSWVEDGADHLRWSHLDVRGALGLADDTSPDN